MFTGPTGTRPPSSVTTSAVVRASVHAVITSSTTFIAEAASAGVDGLIIVDAPPEEDGGLRAAASNAGIDVIRLATPTTTADRARVIVDGASGFLYYVSVAGVTGQASAVAGDVAAAVAGLREASGLPIAVGFGVKTPEQAATFAGVADAVVVGSAIVDQIAGGTDASGLENRPGDPNTNVDAVLGFARQLAEAVHTARAK